MHAATQTLTQRTASLEISPHEGNELESNTEGGEGRGRGRGAALGDGVDKWVDHDI